MLCSSITDAGTTIVLSSCNVYGVVLYTSTKKRRVLRILSGLFVRKSSTNLICREVVSILCSQSLLKGSCIPTFTCFSQPFFVSKA